MTLPVVTGMLLRAAINFLFQTIFTVVKIFLVENIGVEPMTLPVEDRDALASCH